MRKGLIASLAGASIAMLLAQNAAAATVLQLSDGQTTLNIADGGVGDTDARAGAITYDGFLGRLTNVARATGVATPILGSPAQPAMQLNISEITSSGADATFTIAFSVTDFGPTTNAIPLLQISGATNGSVEYDVFFDLDNVLFARTSALGSFDFSAGTFAGAMESIAGITDASYSLTQVITVRHGAATQSTSANASLHVPEPSVLYLLGGGLLALGLSRKQRWRTKPCRH